MDNTEGDDIVKVASRVDCVFEIGGELMFIKYLSWGMSRETKLYTDQYKKKLWNRLQVHQVLFSSQCLLTYFLRVVCRTCVMLRYN
jgi:hypothetical protein